MGLGREKWGCGFGALGIAKEMEKFWCSLWKRDSMACSVTFCKVEIGMKRMKQNS